jgi:hypothetical protein
MLHDSLEHMPDPLRTLATLKRLCAPAGSILPRAQEANERRESDQACFYLSG